MGKVAATAAALWIPLLPLYFLARSLLDRQAGGGRRRKSSSGSVVPPTTFADIAGVGPAVEELREVVACLRGADRFAQLGAKMPSGACF